MFREGDKALFQRRFRERNQVEWGHVDPDDDDFETAVEYRAKVKDLRQRLDVIGFSMVRARSEFEEVKSVEIEKLKEWSKDDDGNLWEDTIKVLEENSFEDYMSAYKEILGSNIHPVYYLKENESASELIQYMLEDNDEFFWGFPCRDFRCFFRVLLEIVPS
tara:strand:- start:1216 stop:1701 length:486 start_codon:yes stop_codon:yes gene_type:complete